jgi:hypothetical protein
MRWPAYTSNHILTLWFTIIALDFVSAACEWASSVPVNQHMDNNDLDRFAQG